MILVCGLNEIKCTLPTCTERACTGQIPTILNGLCMCKSGYSRHNTGICVNPFECILAVPSPPSLNVQLPNMPVYPQATTFASTALNNAIYPSYTNQQVNQQPSVQTVYPQQANVQTSYPQYPQQQNVQTSYPQYPQQQNVQTSYPQYPQLQNVQTVYPQQATYQTTYPQQPIRYNQDIVNPLGKFLL